MINLFCYILAYEKSPPDPVRAYFMQVHAFHNIRVGAQSSLHQCNLILICDLHTKFPTPQWLFQHGICLFGRSKLIHKSCKLRKNIFKEKGGKHHHLHLSHKSRRFDTYLSESGGPKSQDERKIGLRRKIPVASPCFELRIYQCYWDKTDVLSSQIDKYKMPNWYTNPNPPLCLVTLVDIASKVVTFHPAFAKAKV